MCSSVSVERREAVGAADGRGMDGSRMQEAAQLSLSRGKEHLTNNRLNSQCCKQLPQTENELLI